MSGKIGIISDLGRKTASYNFNRIAFLIYRLLNCTESVMDSFNRNCAKNESTMDIKIGGSVNNCRLYRTWVIQYCQFIVLYPYGAVVFSD